MNVFRSRSVVVVSLFFSVVPVLTGFAGGGLEDRVHQEINKKINGGTPSTTILFDAVKADDELSVEKLMTADFNVHAVDGTGNRPLGYVCSIAVAELLCSETWDENRAKFLYPDRVSPVYEIVRRSETNPKLYPLKSHALVQMGIELGNADESSKATLRKVHDKVNRLSVKIDSSLSGSKYQQPETPPPSPAKVSPEITSESSRRPERKGLEPKVLFPAQSTVQENDTNGSAATPDNKHSFDQYLGSGAFTKLLTVLGIGSAIALAVGLYLNGLLPWQDLDDDEKVTAAIMKLSVLYQAHGPTSELYTFEKKEVLSSFDQETGSYILDLVEGQGKAATA